MDGVLIVNKPQGCSSHDIVARVRRRFGVRRVGHAGTLDPLAEGVLVLLIGRATRLAEYVSGQDKEYSTGLLVGLTTDTQDIQGSILEENSAADVGVEQLLGVVDQFTGIIQQIPPMYSAVKIGGQRLYKLARDGKVVERKPREVTVYTLQVDSWQAGERARATLSMKVSSGFYVRTLCHDIGQQMGVGACMEWLVRTVSGPFTLEDAHPLSEIEHWSSSEFRANMLAAEAAIGGMPRVDVDMSSARLFCSGMPVSGLGQEEGIVRVHGETGQFLGIGQMQQDSRRIRPIKVISDTTTLQGDHA